MVVNGLTDIQNASVKRSSFSVIAKNSGVSKCLHRQKYWGSFKCPHRQKSKGFSTEKIKCSQKHNFFICFGEGTHSRILSKTAFQIHLPEVRSGRTSGSDRYDVACFLSLLSLTKKRILLHQAEFIKYKVINIESYGCTFAPLS